MKKFYFLLQFFLLVSYITIAQNKTRHIHFKSGDFVANQNIQKGKLSKSLPLSAHFRKKVYAILQFENVPGENDKKGLAAIGIKLFDYIPENSYMVELPEDFSPATLESFHVTGVFNFNKQFKISQKTKESIQENSNQSKHVIAVSYFGSQTKAEVATELQKVGAKVVNTKIKPPNTIFINASATTLDKIAALPFVNDISDLVLQDEPLNYNNRAAHSLDALNAPMGRNLQGKNVTVGIGDNADPSSHVDFTGRLINRTPNPISVHGTHTSGTIGGGGILDPMWRGMAPQSTILMQSFSDILVNAPVYLSDNDMVVTNNSYYSGIANCPGDGQYNSLSSYVDDQMLTYDSLLHVFASGDDGLFNCSPYVNPYYTIKSGFQCSKNVLCVGAIWNLSYTYALYSSCGPVSDGRLKPEIMAGGYLINSCYPNNNYGLASGTSMSAPTVAGTLALLCERYRQLNGGQSPSSALLKAITCNNADDLGNAGPDYIYGFGNLNARTAVEGIEKHWYFSGTLSNGGKNSYTINSLPSGTQQLKVMLYWNDPAASASAAKALVNNLDLTVTEPNGTITHHPLILNPNPAHVSDLAVEGIDSLNNIEQVVIYNPPSGNYTIQVNGTNVPIGPQNYVIAYQVINPSVTVEYPSGEETWVPGQTEYIRWSAYGGDPNTFNIDFSNNNGATWNNIASNISNTTRLFSWTVPDSATNQALVRVTRNGTSYVGVSSSNFTILGQPSLTVTNPCQGYAQLIWNKIPSATSYQIMMLKGDTMQSIITTTDTTYLLSGLSRDSSYWLSVCAVNGTNVGRRAVASNIVPTGNGACTLFQNDFTVDSLIGPISGRQFTSTQLSNATPISIEVKNLGTLASSEPIPVSYQVNGGNIVTENIALPINSGAAYTYTFSNTYDFSSPGTYNIKTWVSYPSDTLYNNDTLTVSIKCLQNDTIVLNPSFTEGFESAAVGTYYNVTNGFVGLDRCDFTASSSNGRARTFINTGFARTGNRCVTLDQQSYNTNPTADSLITTFNLSKYSSTDQIWLNFYYRNQGIDFSLPGNVVWIRGNDQAAWIPVDTLSILSSSIGNYLPSNNINVTKVLANAVPSQTVSSSFQIKFGEQGYTSANSVITDGDADNGYSFDDITFTKANDDVGIVALLSPNINSVCNLNNSEVVQVQVVNNSSIALSNIQVGYKLNGSTVTESIPSIGAFDTLVYSFSQKADLSAFQNYNLSVWVHYNGDTYPNNDSINNIIFNTTPVISSFPYLEGFETNNGYWYSSGINNDWQWGAPEKQIITKAANGNNCWTTNLTGNYNDNEIAYLYSPCFDLSSLVQPELSFSHIFQTEDDCNCDYHWVEYSTDGVNWNKLGAQGSGTNWYDNSSMQAWQKSDTIWHVSSIDIPTNASSVRFRFVMYSDPAVNFPGVGIDDIHVFDKASVYSGPNIDSGITLPVSGNNWVNFSVGGNMVASINPNGQDLGNTTVKVFVYDSANRHVVNQYYLNRNIVIQPSNQPTDSVSVRFYFLDSEVDSLINASSCGTCTSISDAYESGVTQYSRDPKNEDSTLSNNSHGAYRFILPRSQVAIVPNCNGYYAEYKVAGFSEFWINGGGPNQNLPLALTLQSFTVTKTDSMHALLQWSLVNGAQTSGFIVQKSTDSINFTNIDTIAYNASQNNYQLMDTLVVGENFYRIIILDSNGNYQYSQILSENRSLPITKIVVYPNPVSNGAINIVTPGNCIYLRLTDVLGREVLTQSTSGQYNTMQVPPGLIKGIYFLTVQTENEKEVVKLLIQ